MTETYVEVDRCGWGQYLRYTVYPSGETLVQQPFYKNEGFAGLRKWMQRRDEFFGKLPPETRIRNSAGTDRGTIAERIGSDDWDH